MRPFRVASPSPVPSSASPAATASSAASPAELHPGWSYTANGVDGSSGWFNNVAFASNGDIVTAEVDSYVEGVAVNRVGRDGRVVDGWPWHVLRADLVDIALAPDGSTYVIARQRDEIVDMSWTLHRLDADGQEMSGFPIRLQDDEFCSLTVVPDGAAVTRCMEEFEPANWISTITTVGRDAKIAAGWPVRITGAADIAGFLRDGTIVLGVNDVTSATYSPVARVEELQTDGRRPRAWHGRTFPGYGVAHLDAAGRIALVTSHAGIDCPATDTTSYIRLTDDGRAARGWPIRIHGWGSDPVLRDDGSMVVAASGGRVLAWSLTGQALPGWPRAGIDVASCGPAPIPGSMPVAVGAGALLVLGRTRATRLETSGAVTAGWPVTPADPPAIACPGCPPSERGGPLPPAVGKAGVYVAVYQGGTPAELLSGRPGILVLGADGRAVTGWPDVAGEMGEQPLWVRIAPDGRVWMALRRRVSNNYWSDRLVLLGDDARPT